MGKYLKPFCFLIFCSSLLILIQAGLLMTLFAVMTSFIAMNLVIAVLCDSLIQLHGSDETGEPTAAQTAVGSCPSRTYSNGTEVESVHVETWRCQKRLQSDADRLLVQMEKLKMTQNESMTALRQLYDKIHRDDPKLTQDESRTVISNNLIT